MRTPDSGARHLLRTPLMGPGGQDLQHKITKRRLPAGNTLGMQVMPCQPLHNPHYISQSILVAACRKNTCHASDALPAKTPWAMTMATSPQITHRTPLNKITTTSQIALQLQRPSRSHKHLRPDLSSASFPSLALRTLARPCILQTF